MRSNKISGELREYLHRQTPTATIYLDESGSISSDRFFSVGIVKIVQPNTVIRDMHRLCDKRRFKGELHFSAMTKGEIPLVRDIISLAASSDIFFSCFVADRDKADPILRFGNAWVAYEKLATQLLLANISPGEVVSVLADQYDTPATYSFEASVKRQVNRRLDRLAVVEVNKLDSRSALGLQLVDILTSVIAFEFRIVAGVATATSPKAQLAAHARQSFGIASALPGCRAENINVRLYDHGQWRGRQGVRP